MPQVPSFKGDGGLSVRRLQGRKPRGWRKNRPPQPGRERYDNETRQNVGRNLIALRVDERNVLVKGDLVEKAGLR